MRLAVITPWFPTAVNPSSGAFVLKDCLALAAEGVDLRVFHLVPPHEDDGHRKLLKDGIRVRRIPMSTRNPIEIARAAAQLRSLISTADVIHTQAISAIEPLALGRPPQPWVHTEHWSAITSPQTLPPAAQKALPALLQLEKLPDVVVAVCEFLADPIRQVRGERPVEIIPCQVPSPSSLTEPPRGEVLELLSTGALVDRKDPLLAVRVLASLRQRGVPARLTWLGEGPLRQTAQDLAEQLQVDARFPGSTSAEGVREALAGSDMFLGPTKADNFFVAAAEAIVNGRPLVVGARGGQGEYIDPRVGTLVSSRNPDDYADAIIDLRRRTQPLTATEIAATVGDRFDSTTIARAYIDLYERMLSR